MSSLPFARRKAAPAMAGVIGRAFTAVRPDVGLLLAHGQSAVQADQLLRGVLDVRADAKLRGPRFERKVPRVRTAHPFGNLEVLRRPRLRARPSGGIERKTGIVAVHAAAVFVAGKRTPQACEVYLRRDRATG